ncbi:HTH domain-containing protein, partial [Rossellomorea marisflavi]
MSEKKLLGDERRDWILHTLKSRGIPITGGELAKESRVSRQVIVSDITLLKA